MFDKLHLLSQDVPDGGQGARWHKHPYLRITAGTARGPAVFDWDERQRQDLEALWRDPAADGARERLARDLAAFCDKLGWRPDAALLEDADRRGEEYMLTLSAVPPELYVLPWEVIQVGASGKYLSDHASAQVRYTVPGLEPRQVQPAPPAPGVLFGWSAAGGAVPQEEHAAAIRAAAQAGGATFRELAEVGEASLQAALDAGPLSVLHLLCHGAPGAAGEPPGLAWGAADNPSVITAPRLARLLASHAGAIRLVVLSACGSGDGQDDPMRMGSVAQELYKKAIPSVVASRYPLSVRGSCVMTRVLYDQLLREAWSLERALRHTRVALFRTDEDGESHPGDAYGIQLYACDTERFVSDNNVVAERPVLASYPFGTPARPVPAQGPPAVDLTLHPDADPGLSEEELAGKLRGVSEDDTLTVARPSGAHAWIVRTTVDGAQRLLGAWRSKVLQTAVGVIVGELILTKGIMPAMAATPSAAATPASTAKGVAAAASKGGAAKLAVVAVVGSAVVVGGGVALYRAQTTSTPPAAVANELPPVVPLNASPRDASPDGASPQDASPRDAAPRDAASHDAAPRDAASHDAAPRDAASHDASPQDPASHGAAPQDASPALCGKIIKLKSWKGDYLHRPDTAQGVTSSKAGKGNEWTLEFTGDKIKLKSWKGDYLHRPDTAQGVTSWGTGPGGEWTAECHGASIELKSWKGDYLHRPDTAQGVTSSKAGKGNEWTLE